MEKLRFSNFLTLSHTSPPGPRVHVFYVLFIVYESSDNVQALRCCANLLLCVKMEHLPRVEWLRLDDDATEPAYFPLVKLSDCMKHKRVMLMELQ